MNKIKNVHALTGLNYFVVDPTHLPQATKFVQSCYPKSKKKRIRQKFKKKYGRFISDPAATVFLIPQEIFSHYQFKPKWFDGNLIREEDQATYRYIGFYDIATWKG